MSVHGMAVWDDRGICALRILQAEVGDFFPQAVEIETKLASRESFGIGRLAGAHDAGL